MQKIIILGHENPDVDSVVSGYILEKIMIKSGYNAEFIIPDESVEKETVDICLKYGLDIKKYFKKIDLNDKKNKYILVDHNERKLAGKIIYIIDHHPKSGYNNDVDMLNERSSSTACLICQGNEHLLDKNDIKLAVVATLVDCASFNSTKSRELDKIWVKEICNEYKFDYEELYKEGLCLTPLEDLNKTAFTNLKKYQIDSLNVESSIIQIEKMDGDLLFNIVDIIKKYMIKQKIDAFVLITHNMNELKTTYYLIQESNITIRQYKEYTSRGNTIIPEISKKLLLNK